MTESAVRYFVPEGSRLPQGWRGKLSERRAQLAAFVAGGNAADWADYRHRVGHLNGLHEAIEICEQLEKDEGN